MSEKFGNYYWGRAAWVVGALMLGVALVAKQLIGEPEWLSALAQIGTLILGIGVVVELATGNADKAAFRMAAGLAIGSVVLLGWVNGAVGILGPADSDANLMYAGVIAVGLIGTMIARFKAGGMARTLLAMAIAQTLAAVIALVGRMGSDPLEVITMNGFFVTLFLGSAMLFSKAERGHPDQAVG